MDQCTHFYESMIISHPKENLQLAENANTANWHRFVTGMGMFTSKSKGVSCGDDLPQIPGLYFYSEEDRKVKDKISSNLSSYVRYSAGDTPKSRKPLEGLESELKPLYSRSEGQGLSHFDQATKGNSSLPEGSILQKPSQKSGDSVQAAPEHSTSFIEMEEGENQRVHHCEFPKTVVKLNQKQTTISPPKICVAEENIVNTMLLSYGLSSQTPQTNESIETMKPFFVSKEKPLSLMSEEQKDNKSLLKIWEKRISSKTKEENRSLIASVDNFTLLEKWKDKYQILEKIAPLEEAEVIAFADQELGPQEIHLVARYVTTAVVTHFKNFEARGPLDEKVSIVSTPLRKKYESKQPLKDINYDSSLYQFCEHLTELVISYIISSIYDCTEDGETKQKSLENQDAAFSKVILVHSQVFASWSISVRGLALNISEIIIQILINSDILKEDIIQVVSVKTKYIYCPRVAAADFGDLFQDLLIGVIHVLSKEIGIKHQHGNRGRNKPLSMLKSHSLPICNKTKTMKRQTGPRGWESAPTQQINQLAQKNKLNSLACKLATLAGSLKTHGSKEVVNKIFNIVFNLFLPDECPNWDMNSNKIPRKNKLIRILLEELEGQLFNILQNVEDYCRETMDSGSPFEEYDMSDLLEDLAEINQESMLSITSHTLVKSLIEKLSCGIHQPPRSPLFTSKNLTYSTRERLPSFPKGKRPELKESRLGKHSVRFVSYDSKPLTEPLNNPRVIHSKTQVQFCKQFSGKFSPLPPLQRPGGKNVNITETQLNEINILDDVEERIYFPSINKETVRKIMPTCIINKVLLAISKHKIWLTKYDCQHLYTEKNLQNMKNIVSQSPVMLDRMASLIIQEIIDNHLQPFLCGESLPCSMTPLDEISNMVKGVLIEVTESHRPLKPSLGMDFYPNAFVEDIVAGLLSKVFNPKYNTEYELDKMTQKVVNSINNHFNQAKICILHDDQKQSFPTVDIDTVDKLINSVYEDVLKQHGLAPEVDNEELKSSDIFAENVANLIVDAISDYLFHPLFSGDLSASSYATLTAENIIQNIFSDSSEATKSSQHLSPSNTLLPYTFLEAIIRVLLSRIFPSTSNMVPCSETPKGRLGINCSEISSKLISDIRMKISQHEIRFSKDEETESTYSEDDAQHLADSVLRNILQNSGSKEAVEHDITNSNNVLIDRLAGFIIKNMSAASPSISFLEDVITGVLSKIFHRVLGIVQTNSIRDSGKELLATAEKLIYLITEEFSKAQVSILENAKEQLCLPPVHRDIVIKVIDTVYSKVLQEYELGPDKGFLEDTKTLAERVTKIILAETSTTYTTVLSHTHLEKIVTQVLSQINPLNCSAEDPDFLQSDFSNAFVRLIGETMSIISKHAICIIKHGNEKQNVTSKKDIQAMVEAIYTDISHSSLYQSLTKDKEDRDLAEVGRLTDCATQAPHFESFLSGDKTFPSGIVGQTYQQRATDPEQRELLFIVNSAVFLEDVISELLCRILYVFSHNVLAAENPCKAKANITNIVTTLVKSIVLEFTMSEILVADHLDEKLYFSEGYKEMVKKTVSLIYKKILDDYKSLIHIYRAIQSDAVSFGEKIGYLLLEEIYDYQVESLVLGELAAYSYSSLQDENIIRNVLDTINNDSHVVPSCMTVFPCSPLEDIIYKLLAHIFPSFESETELNEKEVPPDYEFVNAASKLTDKIITEISEHEIRLATAEEHVESMQLGATENFIDSICNNIMKKIKLEDETQSNTCKKGDSFLKIIAGFIMKEIVDHHLQPFLHDEESPPYDLPKNDHIIELLELDKVNKQSFPQTSVYSATFLEDVIIDLVHKFYTLPSIAENPKDKEIPEEDLMGMAIKFANALIGEFRKSKIKVLANAGEMFSFPPIDKETVNKVSDSVYNEVMEMYGSNNVQKDDGSNIVIEMIAALAKKAISAFKIQPLFSGDWSSTFFSFLNVDNIIQRVQHLPYNNFTKINRSLKNHPVSSLKQLSTLTSLTSGLKDVMDTLEIGRGALHGKGNFKKEDTSMKIGSIHEPTCTTIPSIMKGELTTLASGLVGGVANKKKGVLRKSPNPLHDKAAYVTQEDGKNFAQPALTNSAKENVPAKEEENEKTKDKEIKSKPDSPSENNPRFFPANFLENVISEIVNRLIFNSSLGTDAACQNVTNNVNQAEVYDTAMKLIDSLLKEFSDAQIKVLSPGQVGQFLPSADKVSSVHNVPLRQKEPSAPSVANIPSSDKMLVNKIVHSSICNILQEYRSQDSIYKDINSNGENLVRKLANAVIEEILQHQLNLLLYDEVPAAACLPLESKQVMIKVHNVVQTACKECQTSSPYTIMLPCKFLESIISSLLSKIFSTVSNAKTGISEDNLYAELDFLQMKLVGTIMAEISKDEDMIEQCVESLHPNDEIIQLVVQTIYNNLLPQFGSQESIQNCVSSGCKILSETIVNLVIQEVAGNQLQNYFSGELTPHQCIEVDNVVENILKDVIQTTEVPQPQPSWAYKLPFNIIEEVCCNFFVKAFIYVSKTG
ncbi:fibrous sheath-interacting protein 2-like [Prionailurus iriomotensis]